MLAPLLMDRRSDAAKVIYKGSTQVWPDQTGQPGTKTLAEPKDTNRTQNSPLDERADGEGWDSIFIFF